MTQHKVLGLVSGGKDSCFNLLHCAANGHEVIALATLTPEVGTDELDSHLYQSVGTTVPPLIAQAMDMPHYSRIIRGRAVEQGPEYGNRVQGGEGSGVVGDETEDLYKLLQDVMIAHPDLTAISTGAILSTYQRLRIEHVCSRLGLVSLAYLWQADQMPLLEQMKACGMEVVLVKVAGVGLGREMVGSSLWTQLPVLKKLERIYGSHPAGEGGEYETITLDSPLFSHSVKLVNTEIVVSDPEPNLVAYLRIPGAQLMPKSGWIRPTQEQLRKMLGLDQQMGVEGILDEQGREVLEDIGKMNRCNTRTSTEEDLANLSITETELAGPLKPGEDGMDGINFARRGRWFAISTSQPASANSDIGNLMRTAFESIQSRLKAESLSLPLHAAHITLLLPAMSFFPAANASYSKFFGTSPPSRATVAVPLSSGIGLRLEVIGYEDTAQTTSVTLQDDIGGLFRSGLGRVGGRTSLHVQSLSYWAPANIGPYSQAITVDSRVQIAGQIPLTPSTLAVPPYPADGSSPYPEQCVLALQHVRRVINVLRGPMSTGGGWKGWVEGVTAWWAHPDVGGTGGEGVEVVSKAWQSWTQQNECEDAPFLIVRAKELPKGALVEFQVNLHTGRRGDTDAPPIRQYPGEENKDDDDDDDDELEGIHDRGSGGGMRWESYRTSGKRQRGSRAVIFLNIDALHEYNVPKGVSTILDSALSMKVYHLHALSENQVRSSLKRFSTSTDREVGMVLIPVYEIHDRNGEKSSIALEVFGM